MRFYGLRLPEAIRVEEPGMMLRLMSGLTGIDGSLYREWVITHRPPTVSDDDDDSGEIRLIHHGFTQDSQIMLSIRNMVEMLVYAKSDGSVKPNPWLPPDAPKSREIVEEASFESMWAMIRAAKQG